MPGRNVFLMVSRVVQLLRSMPAKCNCSPLLTGLCEREAGVEDTDCYDTEAGAHVLRVGV